MLVHWNDWPEPSSEPAETRMRNAKTKKNVLNAFVLCKFPAAISADGTWGLFVISMTSIKDPATIFYSPFGRAGIFHVSTGIQLVTGTKLNCRPWQTQRVNRAN